MSREHYRVGVLRDLMCRRRLPGWRANSDFYKDVREKEIKGTVIIIAAETNRLRFVPYSQPSSKLYLKHHRTTYRSLLRFASYEG